MSKLKVLFFAANPLSTSRLEIGREARDIEEEVMMSLRRDAVEFRSCWATRTQDMRRALLREKPDIVHFSGHGGSEGLIVEASDGRGAHRVGAAALKEFFQAFRGQTRVVVLNACHSQPQAEAIAEVVECVIGTPSKIQDPAARAFSTAFYSSVAFGQPVQAAFDQARAALKMDDYPDGERPVLEHRKDVDPSALVLIPTAVEPPDPPPPPPRRLASKLVAALVLIGSAVFAITSIDRPDPCERAREAGRAVMEAGAPRPQGLLSAPSGATDDPLAGPRELVEAKQQHQAGDHAAEFALLRQAVEAGSAEAMTSLGLAFLRGEGVPVQRDSARKYLRAAADKGDLRGMTELANGYVRREWGSRNLDGEAAHWYQKAADQGYPEAMRQLGNLYRQGRGVEANGAAALDLYERAAGKGLVDALVEAGKMYREGKAVAPDRRQALCWYEAAADAGSPRGQAELARVKRR
jgi:TPR repeat protein